MHYTVESRIVYTRFWSKAAYLLHRIKNHNTETENQKPFVDKDIKVRLYTNDGNLLYYEKNKVRDRFSF